MSIGRLIKGYLAVIVSAVLYDCMPLMAKYIYADTWRCELGSCRKRKPPKPQLDGLEYDEKKMPIDHKNEEEQ